MVGPTATFLTTTPGQVKFPKNSAIFAKNMAQNRWIFQNIVKPMSYSDPAVIWNKKNQKKIKKINKNKIKITKNSDIYAKKRLKMQNGWIFQNIVKPMSYSDSAPKSY